MKNRLLILLLVILVSLLCSCDMFHTHQFDDEYMMDETHHWHECECGEKGDYAEHKWNAGAVTVKPTVESEGVRTYTCTVCLCKKNEEIPKLEPGHIHNYNVLKNDENSHWYECECGEAQEAEAHEWDAGQVTVHPTVDSEGVRTYTCEVCDRERTESIEKIDPDHSHVYDIKQSNEHSHWYECKCGSKESMTSHKWDEGVVTTPAGDVETGIKTFTCAACGRKSTQLIASETASGLSFLQSTHYRISEKLPKTPLTLEAKIYVPKTVTGRAGAIFGNYIGIREDWLVEIHENGVPRFYYSDAAGNVRDYKFTEVDVRTGDWVHIALTFDYENKKISFYMNGELAQAITCEADLAEDVTRYQFVVGGDNRSNNDIYFKGKIASVAAYSEVRTAEEIASSAQNGTNLYADGLLVAYLLNENSAGKDIEDFSGNGLNIPKEWLDSHEPTLDYAYSFAVIGDTQWMSKYTTEKMEGIYDWLIANKDSKKIAHVFGLGDITEDWNTANKEQEWIKAQQYISKLDGVIPYSLIRGNHDESKYFLKYFANETYMSQFDGFIAEGDIRNSYKLFTVGSTDYLFLTLDFGAGDEMLDWANEVVLAHPNHRVIVTTHGYQGFDGGHLNSDNTPSSGGTSAANDVDTSVGDNGGRGYNNGQQIWEKFVSRHPNIFLVMSGHTPFEDIILLQTKGVHGNVVNQMVIDAQWMDPQKGGMGMVCMLYFSEDGSQMEVEWLSTDTGKYYKEMNQFVLDLDESLNAPAHEFYDSYNETYHYKKCDCGYIHSEEPHVFDGGVLNDEGFMVYTCECGYKRETSATNDPIAIELQAILEKFYNGGVYFKDVVINSTSVTTFYNGEEFWTADAEDKASTEGHLTLHDLVMGKYGDLRLDLGWNCYDGVYSSVNESTVNGVSMFVLDTDTSEATKATVEKKGSHLIIKLLKDESVLAEATVGMYATTTLVKHDGEVLGVVYTKAAADGLCTIITPEFSGYVAEYDKIILDSKHSALDKTVYYSTIVAWDGTSVSSGLQGSGTKEDPFLVQSGADLAYIAQVVNNAAAQTPNFSGKYFKLTQSIDLNGHNLYIGSYPGWSTRKGFYGFFDGNHCTVRGLNSTNSLFGTIEGGYLINLSVYGKVNGNTTVGGIVGYVANGGKIENLTSYVTVTGNSTLGGIVGNAESQASTVINCVNYGSVTGPSYIIGGIAGSGGHDIINCVNFGNVTSTGNDVVGGIAGTTKDTGKIENCYNYGTVKARGKSGGIVGQLIKPIVGCVNYGDVIGTWALGGIAGYVKEGTASISNCVNNGNITGATTGNGGILGLSEEAAKVTITNCVNNGNLQCGWGCGGIVGDTYGTVTNCVNNGTVSAPGDLGGIVGKTHGEVSGCVNNGKVIGTSVNVGGIVGRLHSIAYLNVINKTNENNGEVSAPDPKNIIGVTEGEVSASDDIKGINHRGWYEAPENTLSAYRESHKHGFTFVECDVQFTKDGVPVLLHDDTIDRTSNGSGKLSQMTYEELLAFDFSYDDNDTEHDFSAYRGEKIPKFVDFIALCKGLGLHPYIEIKGTITDEEAKALIKIVSDAGMLDNVSWLGFSGEALAKIVQNCDTARIVWVMTDTNASKIEANNIPFAKASLMTGKNEVVFDLWHSLAKQDVCDLLKANNIPLEVWTVNDINTIISLNPYVSGVTSDMYNANQVVADAKSAN